MTSVDYVRGEIRKMYCKCLCVLMGLFLFVNCTVYVGVKSKKGYKVTRDEQKVKVSNIQKLHGDTYVVENDEQVTWCVKENNTMKLVSRPKDCVKVIEGKEDKVYKFNGKRHSEIFGFINLKDKVDVFEIHTTKPILYQTSKCMDKKKDRTIDNVIIYPPIVGK